MDKKIRDIEWYIYLTSPGHTAFKICKLIRFFRSGREKKTTQKDEPPPVPGRELIELLNALILEAADFVLISYRIGRFPFNRVSFTHCRGPPIQEFYPKFLNLWRIRPCGREIKGKKK